MEKPGPNYVQLETSWHCCNEYDDSRSKNPGHYRALFHDDGRFISEKSKKQNPTVFTLYSCLSTDGGKSWQNPVSIYSSSFIHLCEPGAVRSPDGKQIAVLLRENSRKKNSYLIVSDDEGKSWSKPKELPITLTGDRHTAKYLPDGRLLFRSDAEQQSALNLESLKVQFPTKEIGLGGLELMTILCKASQVSMLLKLQIIQKNWDTSYPGVEILEDGNILTTTYGHWKQNQAPYIIAVRIKAAELDEIAKNSPTLEITKTSMALRK